MAQDIRKMMKDHKPEGPKPSKGHEARFEARLKEAFSEKSQEPGSKDDGNASFLWLKIAAVIVVCLGVGFWYFNLDSGNGTEQQLVENEVQETEAAPQITLGDISPEFKKVEEFYTNGINLQLASLKIDPKNKELIDGYKKRLSELDIEYKRLTIELNEVGPTEATVTALIDNLKLRLDLLFKLKNKLKELKQLENEEFENSNVI